MWMHIEFMHAASRIYACINKYFYIGYIHSEGEKYSVLCVWNKTVHCNFLVGFFYKDLHSDMVKHKPLCCLLYSYSYGKLLFCYIDMFKFKCGSEWLSRAVTGNERNLNYLTEL